MVNKKGVIKTLEAIIAIVLILIFIYTIMPIEEPKEPVNPIKKYENFITKDISYNESIREKLNNIPSEGLSQCDKNCPVRVDCDPDCKVAVEEIDWLIKKTITYAYGYFFKICNQPSCVASVADIPMDKSIYMFDVLIGSSQSTETPNPLIVRAWVWSK